jgi:WD40 repeat protein
VRGVAFSGDGRMLAGVGGSEPVGPSKTKRGEVRIWNVGDGRLLANLSGHKDAVLYAAFTADCQALLTGGRDGAICVWDVGAGIEQEITGQQLRTLRGHSGRVTSLAASPTGELVASGSDDGTVRIWNARTWKCEDVLSPGRDGACCLAFAPDGETLAACWKSLGAIFLWNPATREVRQRFLERSEDDTADFALTFTRGGQRLAVLSQGQAKVWDIASCQVLMTCEALGMHGFACSPCSDLMALGGFDLTTGYDIQLASADTGDPAARLKGHSMPIQGLAFSPDGQLLASAGRDGTVRLWETPKLEPQP